MSKIIVEITQSDSFSKDSLPKNEITSDRNMSNLKLLRGTKKIVFISLLIFFILALFISCAYLLHSKKAKTPLNMDELGNEKRRASLQDKLGIQNIRARTEIPRDNIGGGTSSTRTSTSTGSSRSSTSTSASTRSSSNTIPGASTRSAQVTTSFSGYERKVLLISNYVSKKTDYPNKISPDVIYDILRDMKKISLTILDPYDSIVNSKGINYLKTFHLVVLDFVDGGFNLASRFPNFVIALMQYIKEGGALFTCHDQFDETHDRYITSIAKEMLQLLGFKHVNSHGANGSLVYFDKTAISNYFFVANHAIYGDSFNIAYSHQTYSRYDESCTTCKVILKFNSNGSNSQEYLVINRPYKGKTLNIRAGHSYGFTEPEKKIFLSSILWLLYEM